MLGHQLPLAAAGRPVLGRVAGILPLAAGAVVPQLLPSIRSRSARTVLRGPAGGIRIPGRSTPFIEVIRFAASNHLLVELDYRDEQGNRRTRPIEPYSLRRTQEGNILLCAVNAERQQPRSYRIERIQGATIMNRGFTPRYRD